MAFIGAQPTIGNFVKLDAISTSSTNTYNLRDIVVGDKYGTTNAQQGCLVVFENSGA